MKIEVISETKPSFKPVKLEIIFESADEIDALYCLFNYGPLTNFLYKHNIDSKAFRYNLDDHTENWRTLWPELLDHINKF